MAAVYISEAELARDLHAVLERVRLGDEVVIEQDRRAVAILKPPVSGTRTMSEIISAMESGGTHGIVDEDFAGDVEKGITAHDEPWNPSGLD